MIGFSHPFSMIVAGPSCCGKTTFITLLVNNLNKLVSPSIEKIIWCNSEINAIPKNLEFENIEYQSGLPDNFQNNNQCNLIILDDLMLDAYGEKICELFTKGSHHRNLSIILVTQNIFHQGKFCRDISLNCKYLVLFRNPRDKTQILHLARQIFPENAKEFQKVFNEATSTPYGHIILDFTQDINDLFRIRNNLFNKDKYCEFFCSSKKLTNSNLCDKNETIEGKPTYIACIKKE